MSGLSQNDLDQLLRSAHVEVGQGDGRFSLSLELRRDCLFLAIRGKVIQPVIPDSFADTFARLVEGGAGKGVIIDLRGCDYLSSGAVGFIVQFFHAVTERGSQVIMLQPITKIRKLIEILGLNHYFLIVDDEDTAVEFYRAQEVARKDDDESRTGSTAQR